MGPQEDVQKGVYEGVIRSSILIDPKGIVRRTWPKAQAKGHAKEMLEALKALKG